MASLASAHAGVVAAPVWRGCLGLTRFSFLELDECHVAWTLPRADAAGRVVRYAMWNESRQGRLPWKVLVSLRRALLGRCLNLQSACVSNTLIRAAHQVLTSRMLRGFGEHSLLAIDDFGDETWEFDQPMEAPADNDIFHAPLDTSLLAGECEYDGDSEVCSSHSMEAERRASSEEGDAVSFGVQYVDHVDLQTPPRRLRVSARSWTDADLDHYRSHAASVACCFRHKCCLSLLFF